MGQVEVEKCGVYLEEGGEEELIDGMNETKHDIVLSSLFAGNVVSLSFCVVSRDYSPFS